MSHKFISIDTFQEAFLKINLYEMKYEILHILRAKQPGVDAPNI